MHYMHLSNFTISDTPITVTNFHDQFHFQTTLLESRRMMTLLVKKFLASHAGPSLTVDAIKLSGRLVQVKIKTKRMPLSKHLLQDQLLGKTLTGFVGRCVMFCLNH